MSEYQHIEGERHVSEIAGKRPNLRRRHAILLAGVSALAIASYVAVHYGGKKLAVAGAQAPEIHSVVQFEPPKEEPVVPQAPVAPPPPPSPLPRLIQEIVPTGDPLAKDREAPLFGKDYHEQPEPVSQRMPDAPGLGGQQNKTELTDKLKPTPLDGATANVIEHPSMTVTQGTLVPCALNTAISSDAPGFVTCTTMQDVFGSTGTVVVMEKGTKIFGEYSSQMAQGKRRLFVLWSRAETPNHVVIALASPGADALGRAGLEGEVNNHWWPKFGAALMLTLIDGGFSLGSAALSHGGSTFFNFGTGQSVANTALQNQIDVPPTLEKNQGEIVSVMVARDLDFSTVYNLRTVGGR